MKRLSLPRTLAITVVTTTLLGCPEHLPNGEQPCSYYCSSDAALAESKSDMFAGQDDPIFTSDAGSCFRTFC